MSSQRITATLIVSLFLLSGCLSDEALPGSQETEDCTGESCEDENTVVEEEILEEEIPISGTNFCDNLAKNKIRKKNTFFYFKIYFWGWRI